MGKTQVRTQQIEDGGVTRDDLNTTIVGQAVIRKLVQGTRISLSSTGADAGTGDVTANADLTLSFNTQTDTDYTLVSGDAQTGVKMNSSAAHTLTVPPNASVAFPTGTQIVIEQGGAGLVTIAPGSGVTLQGQSLITGGQYSVVSLIKQDTNTWLVVSPPPVTTTYLTSYNGLQLAVVSSLKMLAGH